MSNFAVVRLGKDSVKDIKQIDSIRGKVAAPLQLTVRCSQVPTELKVGDYVFFCLGSDNNNGLPTPWTRGMRALGTIKSKIGGITYNSQSEIGVEIKVVLPESVTRKLLLKKSPTAYIDFSDIPVLGIDTHSNQTIQLIKTGEPDQDVSALMFALNQLFPGFCDEVIQAYPELSSIFNYVPLGIDGKTDSSFSAADLASPLDLGQMSADFVQTAHKCSFRVTLTEARRFFACLLAKRFLIATGLSGSGKTRLAQAVARWISPANEIPSRVAVVSVGADWTGNESILGYPDGLDQSSYIGKPALRIILNAMTDPDQPYFLILDEMNLSHVERYFADLLSALESDEAINLHSDKERLFDGVPVPRSAPLPANLFIIGTMNVDETTYMFSPKVLDRANVIEFRMKEQEMQNFLQNPIKPDMSALAGKGAGFGQALVAAASVEHSGLSLEVQELFHNELLLFFQILREDGAEFGYRVASESARFVYFYELLGARFSKRDELHEAFDFLILQKFLPKLHGSRTKLGVLLKKLWILCITPTDKRPEDFLSYVQQESKGSNKNVEPSIYPRAGAPYPYSAEKIARMWRQLNENGFASFAEA